MSDRETHMASDYERRSEEPSVLLPGAKIVRYDPFCPSCLQPCHREHNVETTCPTCGLHMLLQGNRLTIWKETS